MGANGHYNVDKGSCNGPKYTTQAVVNKDLEPSKVFNTHRPGLAPTVVLCKQLFIFYWNQW